MSNFDIAHAFTIYGKLRANLSSVQLTQVNDAINHFIQGRDDFLAFRKNPVAALVERGLDLDTLIQIRDILADEPLPPPPPEPTYPRPDWLDEDLVTLRALQQVLPSEEQQRFNQLFKDYVTDPALRADFHADRVQVLTQRFDLSPTAIAQAEAALAAANSGNLLSSFTQTLQGKQ